MSGFTRRTYIARRIQQAEHCLRRAQVHLAVVRVSLQEQHPEYDPSIRSIIYRLDSERRSLLLWYIKYFGLSTKGLWERGSTERIIADAKPVKDSRSK